MIGRIVFIVDIQEVQTGFVIAEDVMRSPMIVTLSIIAMIVAHVKWIFLCVMIAKGVWTA